MLDGTDNFETRFLLNDAALKFGIPWVYGGCLGAEGQTMTIIPGKSGCLRCLIEDAPPPGTTPTCDTAGIVASIIGVIASIQALEAIKIASGNSDAVSPYLTVVDLWENHVRQIRVQQSVENRNCPACDRGEFPWLEGKLGSHSAVLCGRNAVQLSAPRGGPAASLDALKSRLEGVGEVTANKYLLRLAVEEYVITVFADGRTIVGGTDDPAVARSVNARYIGN
jgi:adenylyltransferase/sulfurtransferase